MCCIKKNGLDNKDKKEKNNGNGIANTHKITPLFHWSRQTLHISTCCNSDTLLMLHLIPRAFLCMLTVLLVYSYLML